MREIDLPCSECGTELAERVVFAADLPVETGWRGSVRVAECPSCGARYYPRQTVAQLAGRANETPAGTADQ
ncbi:hypothetical protein [Halosimplex halophilum]|uniref:hypothetical protein n=1 Tax=Halosimplex halophilum TaxID=2559572 RepID=UPI00107F264A|nr:hypothetical protein [Halosimplex halophilum]